MRWVTYKHILSWWWDDIIIKDWNWAIVNYWSVNVSFENDIYIRGKDWQEEILITFDNSPMVINWATNNWFPYQIKWTWTLFFITLN